MTQILGWIASCIVLAAVLHHLESLDIFAAACRWAEGAKAAAWIVIGIDAFANVIRPCIHPIPPSAWQDVLGMIGLAILLSVYEIKHVR